MLSFLFRDVMSLKYEAIKLEKEKMKEIPASTFFKANDLDIKKLTLVFKNDTKTSKAVKIDGANLSSLETGNLIGCINATEAINAAGHALSGEGENGKVNVFAGALKDFKVELNSPFYVVNTNAKTLKFTFDSDSAKVKLQKYKKEDGKINGEAENKTKEFTLESGVVALVSKTGDEKDTAPTKFVITEEAAAVSPRKALEDVPAVTFDFTKPDEKQYYTSDTKKSRTEIKVEFEEDVKPPKPEDDKEIKVDINDTEKFYTAKTADKGGKITVTYMKPHGFFGVKSEFKNITINLISPSDGKTIVDTKKISYETENPFAFFDAGKYHMVVTAEFEKEGSVLANCFAPTKRIFGSTEKLDVVVQENESVYVHLWTTPNNSQNKKYKYALTDIEAKKVATEEKKSLADQAEKEEQEIWYIFSYKPQSQSVKSGEQAVKSGKIAITNDGEKNGKIVQFDVTEKPVSMAAKDEKPSDVEVNEGGDSEESSSSEGGNGGNGGSGNGSEDDKGDVDNGKSNLAPGAIAGIVIACVAVVAVVSVVTFLAVKKKACFAKKVESLSP